MAKLKNHQLINQDSGKTEWYTPGEIVEAARATMGGIDLDPASSIEANKIVQAKRIFTAADNGLSFDWFGRVWMNHPYGGKKQNDRWVSYLVNSYLHGGVTQACCITYANLSTHFANLLVAFPRWIPKTRINFIDGFTMKVKSGVSKGVMVTYMGPLVETFATEFGKLGGNIVVNYQWHKEKISWKCVKN